MSRVAIPLTADGRVAVDRMRQGTRDQLVAMLRDPDLARALGLTPDATATALPPAMILPVVHALSQLETIVVARLTGAPAEIVLRVAPYTPAEQEVLAPVIGNVLNKHAGAFLGRWGDEVALIALLVSLTTAKVQAIQDAMRQAPGTVHPFRVPVTTDTPSETVTADA